MKTMTVAFIGHRNLRQNRETAKIINTVIYKLINEVNAETFLFGGVGHFDDVSLAVVTYLKQKYFPLIQRINIRSRYPTISNMYKSFLLTMYDDTVFPEELIGAGRCTYVKRNQIMIDRCDILVTYFDKDYCLADEKKSGTKIAVEYAQKKHKHIINIFEFK